VVSPIEAYSRLLKDCDPSKAAEVLAAYVSWRWRTAEYDPDAPAMVREMADRDAWERFSAPDLITRKEVAAQYLFRAASYQAGAARSLLIDHAQSLIGEVINTWLKDRPDL
jgi:hypothetical protein